MIQGKIKNELSIYRHTCPHATLVEMKGKVLKAVNGGKAKARKGRKLQKRIAPRVSVDSRSFTNYV